MDIDEIINSYESLEDAGRLSSAVIQDSRTAASFACSD